MYEANVEYAEGTYRILHDIKRGEVLSMECPANKFLTIILPLGVVAARNLAAGEVIDYKPGKSTKDIWVRSGDLESAVNSTWSVSVAHGDWREPPKI